MRAFTRLACLLVAIGGAPLAPAAAAERAKGTEPAALESSLVALPRAFTGSASPSFTRGVPGGGLPWVLSSGKAELRGDGALEVEVTGLVLDPNDPTVISRGLAGQNPIPMFKAIVSCLTVSGGAPATENVETATVPATTGAAADGGGDAKIEAQLALPSPCIAPVVFVTSPAGAWFAATGF